jgi:N-acetylneuraminate synthase
MNNFNIDNILVGDDCPPVVITELGINHGGSLETAIALAKLAIDSGSKLIKHQTHLLFDEMSNEAKSISPGNSTLSIYEVISQNSLNTDDETKLIDYVRSRGAVYISSPFSRSAVDFLDSMDVPCFKIGSGECNNYPFVEYVASKGRPVILSTGMNSIASIKPSVEIFEFYKIPYALLHCTNIYPTPQNLIRLDAMLELKSNFPNAVIGLSDHSTSNAACLGAVGLGASLIERHFTDSKLRFGPDISCSMTPNELRDLIKLSNEIFLAKGGGKRPLEEEGKTIAFAFASVVVTNPIKKDEIFTPENIWVMRPGGGDYGPKDLKNLYGKKSKFDLQAGFQLKATQVYE